MLLLLDALAHVGNSLDALNGQDLGKMFNMLLYDGLGRKLYFVHERDEGGYRALVVSFKTVVRCLIAF